MSKPRLWLLFSELRNPELGYVIPTVAWMAGDAGVLFETYLESEREGRLFAETGSTVIGGHHHQQFNYLCAAFEVSILRLGRSAVFDSSVRVFGLPVIAEGANPSQLYAMLLSRPGVPRPGGCFLGPRSTVSIGRSQVALPPYLFPEILHRRALGASSIHAVALRRLCAEQESIRCFAAFLTPGELKVARKAWPKLVVIDRARSRDTWGTVTLRIARRWKRKSRGVVFGDPPAVLSQLATHCRHARVALYQPAHPLPPAAIAVSHYIETTSPIATATARLAVEIGNRLITGRQTGDGDIFEWSRHGVSIQIIDPNRPAFPAVECITHPWEKRDSTATAEPSDAQLRRWSRENKVLTTLVFHSGEVAHNEAMLALIEMAGWTGLKLGLGVHAARYETCPQLWELIGIPPSRGGALGLVEPLLHSGGLGVMAECNCPPPLLRENCAAALARIREIAGPANVPRGYYAFMDSNLDRLDHVRGDLFSAISSTGLDYIISSALPGRNRILWRARNSGCLALNQSPRVVHGASPFVRATTPEDIHTSMGSTGPGWMIATLDAPVISFSPYIWRHGGRFLRLIEEELRGEGRINVTPHVVARYARIVDEQGFLPTR
jgi:hypothetical protein